MFLQQKTLFAKMSNQLKFLYLHYWFSMMSIKKEICFICLLVVQKDDLKTKIFNFIVMIINLSRQSLIYLAFIYQI